MNVSELMEIVRDEDLETPVIYGVGQPQSETVVLERDGDRWQTFVSDERGGVLGETLREFSSEKEALDYVLAQVRQGTRYHRALQARSAE